MAEMHVARQLIGRFLATGLLAAHLVVISMAMSPALHHWLHGDADESDHHCAITAMIDGQFDRPETLCLSLVRPLTTAESRIEAAPVPPCLAVIHASPGERAPPLA